MNAVKQSRGSSALLEFRSLPALMMGGVLSTVLVLAALLGWVMLGGEIRQQFNIPQILTLIGFIVIIIGIMMAIGLSKLVADDTGITVRNGLRTNHFGWDEITDVQLSEGDPWAYLVTTRLDDQGYEKNHMVLAIQSSEGPAAQQHATQLRELVLERNTAAA
ncbi:hypothetical protein GCM10009638_04420 [Luteococcus sanguinis]